MLACPHETFPSLTALPVWHAFTQRVPGINVRADRAIALARLAASHEALTQLAPPAVRRIITAQQVHGAEVAIVRACTLSPVPEADALITDDPSVCLAITVADCGPVWLVDPIRRAIGCVHSGRKGTDLGIVTAAIAKMVAAFGCTPAHMTAQLGPCIRPPHYEVDFASQIIRQCREAGLQSIHDCGTCTANHPDHYYSYRREKGQTGRMVALLALA